MKRFYCSVCMKIKRVRRWPSTVHNVDAIHPADRIGVCERHIIYRATPGQWTAENQQQAEGRMHRKVAK
jgi:hypothetical protein